MNKFKKILISVQDQLKFAGQPHTNEDFKYFNKLIDVIDDAYSPEIDIEFTITSNLEEPMTEDQVEDLFTELSAMGLLNGFDPASGPDQTVIQNRHQNVIYCDFKSK